jgi:hypothetical protein
VDYNDGKGIVKITKIPSMNDKNIGRRPISQSSALQTRASAETVGGLRSGGIKGNPFGLRSKSRRKKRRKKS